METKNDIFDCLKDTHIETIGEEQAKDMIDEFNEKAEQVIERSKEVLGEEEEGKVSIGVAGSGALTYRKSMLAAALLGNVAAMVAQEARRPAENERRRKAYNCGTCIVGRKDPDACKKCDRGPGR